MKTARRPCPRERRSLLAEAATSALLLLHGLALALGLPLIIRAETASTNIAATHWAYQPLRAPALPTSPKTPDESLSEIDLFIRARLQQEGLAASPEAAPHTLLRRLYADLLGLPPTPDQLRQFLAAFATNPKLAWIQEVERCLGSPHFGERWGRHWLDQARYADSDGYEKDSPRPDAWRYRDWVIDSFNRDQPFDQFTIEQLAGDLLPNASPEQKLATAFHRQTLTNREGGVEQEQYRVEAVFDRTETTATVWLGLTMGCARCHDHKYEPFTQQDYYQLFAFFNNADEANTRVGESRNAFVNYQTAHPEALARVLHAEEELTQQRNRLAKGFSAWESSALATLRSLEGTEPQVAPLLVSKLGSSAAVSTSTRPTRDGWTASTESTVSATQTATLSVPPGRLYGLRLEIAPGVDPESEKSAERSTNTSRHLLREFSVSVRGTPGSLSLHSAKADLESKEGPIANVLDGKPDTGWAIPAPTNNFGTHHATFFFRRALESDGTLELQLELNHGRIERSSSLGSFRVLAVTNATEESVGPADVRRLARIGIEKWTEPDRERLLEWLIDLDPSARQTRDALSQAERSARPPLMSARVIVESTELRPTYLFSRGEYLHPKQLVQAGVPPLLGPLHSASASAHQPNRLDLARWIAHPNHPLTARVAVNQIWQHLLGEGLVRTPSDFGLRGERPSHPELLDWLAQEFIRSGWSRKALIRRVVLSATYRQRSHHRPELDERDPMNRLLARQNRQRVEAEIVRDFQLAVSGLLNPKVGGPSVYPALPPDVAEISYANNFKWPESKGAERHRRGMYTFFKRTAPHPDLVTFDCPDANLTNVKRNISNTPLQALAVLNAQAFVEAALATARSLLDLAGANDETRFVEAFQRCFSRSPEPNELRSAGSLLSESRDYYRHHPDDAVLLTSEGSQRSIELAAWTTTVRALLNADEMLTRE